MVLEQMMSRLTERGNYQGKFQMLLYGQEVGPELFIKSRSPLQETVKGIPMTSPLQAAKPIWIMLMVIY